MCQAWNHSNKVHFIRDIEEAYAMIIVPDCGELLILTYIKSCLCSKYQENQTLNTMILNRSVPDLRQKVIFTYYLPNIRQNESENLIFLKAYVYM